MSVPTTVSYHGKVSDMYTITVRDQNGDIMYNDTGYVGQLGGDYIRLTIDNATGKIMDWKPVTVEDIEKAHDY